ncbi:unnamed protein product [Boreogadus saida]
MFNSLTRDFEEDPFFSDPFQAHNDRVRQMMRSFSDPFGGSPFMPSLTDCREQRRGSAAPPGTSLTLRDEHRHMISNLKHPLTQERLHFSPLSLTHWPSAFSSAATSLSRNRSRGGAL